MKNRLMAWAFVALMGGMAMAQPSLAPGAESKRVTAAMIDGGRYVGQHEGLHCWLTRSPKSTLGTLRKNEWFVLMADQNLEPLKALGLPQSHNCELLACTLHEGRLCALLADQSESRRSMVYAAVANLDSMRVEGGALRLVDSVALQKKDRCMLWGATSPDGSLLALVEVVQFGEKKQYTASATVFDSELREVWSKQYALGSLHQVFVTNDGTLVTLGYENDDPDVHFVFNVLGPKKSESYGVTVKCEPISSLYLANVTGGRAVAVGTFRPAKLRGDHPLCGGVVGMSFGISEGALLDFTIRPFQNEDINILENEKTSKVQRNQVTDLVKVLGCEAVGYGGVLALGRNYDESYVEANGTLRHTHHAYGVHLAAVDTTGRIRWVRNLRRNDVQKGDDDLLRVVLCGVGDNLCVLKNEGPKQPAAYDIAKAAKTYTVGDKSNLALYSIGADGTVEKHILEHKTKQQLLAAEQLHAQGLLLLTGKGGKTRAAEATLK